MVVGRRGGEGVANVGAGLRGRGGGVLFEYAPNNTLQTNE